MTPSHAGVPSSPRLAAADERSTPETSGAERAVRGRNSGERRAVRPAPIVFAEPPEFLRGFRLEPRRNPALMARLAQVGRGASGRRVGWLSSVARRWNPQAALTWRDEISGETRVLPYFELEARSNQFARALHEHGVGPRSRVVVALGCRPELLIVVAGLLKLGAEVVLAESGADPEQLVELAPSHALVGPEWLAALGTLLQWLPRERVLGVSDPQLPVSDADVAGLVNLTYEASRLAGTSLGVEARLERSAALCVVPHALPHGNGWAPAWCLGTARWRGIGAGFAGEWHLSCEDTVYVARGEIAGLLCGWAAALSRGACIAFCRSESREAVTSDLWRFNASAFLYSARRP